MEVLQYQWLLVNFPDEPFQKNVNINNLPRRNEMRDIAASNGVLNPSFAIKADDPTIQDAISTVMQKSKKVNVPLGTFTASSDILKSKLQF